MATLVVSSSQTISTKWIFIPNIDVVPIVTTFTAPLYKVEIYKAHEGWNFQWVASIGNEFDRDVQLNKKPLMNDRLNL